jgi:hypothetical protein
MVVNRNTLASAFQLIEELNRFFVLENVNLAAFVLANPVVRSGDPVPTQRDNQDLGLGLQEPLNLFESQFVRFGDLASAAIGAHLEI